MRPVVYSMGVSLDGYIAGPGGDIAWSAPSAELHRFYNEQTRAIGVHLCGRGLYETMLGWESVDDTDPDPVAAEFARIWKPLPKVVFSRTLSDVKGNARLATGTVTEELETLRQVADDREVSVGGARLAASLIQLDLIDEYRQFVSPIILGAGTPFFPPTIRSLELELLETRTFSSRVVYLRYRRTRG